MPIMKVVKADRVIDVAVVVVTSLVLFDVVTALTVHRNSLSSIPSPSLSVSFVTPQDSNPSFHRNPYGSSALLLKSHLDSHQEHEKQNRHDRSIMSDINDTPLVSQSHAIRQTAPTSLPRKSFVHKLIRNSLLVSGTIVTSQQQPQLAWGDEKTTEKITEPKSEPKIEPKVDSPGGESSPKLPEDSGLLEGRVSENLLSPPTYGMEGSDIFFPS